MFPLANGETIVRLRGTLVADKYSGEATVRNWETPDRLDIHGVAIQPSTSIETTSPGRQAVITAMSLFGPPDMDVQAKDRIEARSGTWEVEGEVQNWTNAFTGWNPGVEFSIKKVAG